MEAHPPPPSIPPEPRSAPRPTVDSVDLFGRARELVILHRGQEYRLRITRSGKLILTK